MATSHLTKQDRERFWRANAARNRVVLMDGTKTCRVCGVEKDIHNFCVHRLMVGGRTHECRACINKRQRAWAREARKNPAFVADRKLSQSKVKAKKYGLTVEQVLAFEARKLGPCDLCGRPPRSRGKDIPGNADKVLHIDHCHTTGRVRGMLCGDCNRGIGLFMDSPQLFRKVADYLERE